MEGFDTQAAWLRRFQADAESSLQSFALRLREAMPERVRVLERKGLFSRKAMIVGVQVEMEQNRYMLELVQGRLKASIALVVRDVAISTRALDPAEWFVRLSEETQKASDHARRLAQSLSAFMAS